MHNYTFPHVYQGQERHESGGREQDKEEGVENREQDQGKGRDRREDGEEQPI